jgi:NADH-quinone oxidoreductase subunit L
VVGKMPWEETAVAIGVGLVTMLAAAALFAGALRMRPWTAYAPWAQRILEHKYYFDELYDGAFVRPMDWVAGFLLRDVEQPVIDAAVVDTGLITRASASGLSLTQSGYFRNYILVFIGGAAIAAAILLVRAST